jgi:hypothetical protein
MKFIEYTLTSEMLCMGERIKKGQFRPTVTTIPYSQITGALKAVFGNKDIHAVGHFLFDNDEQAFRRNHVQMLTYSPRDRALDTSILPLYIEYLMDVEGKVFIAETEDAENVFGDKEDMTVYMGAFKSQGFGWCELKRYSMKNEDLKIEEGLLNTRIPIERAEKIARSKEKVDSGEATDFLKEKFEIEKVIKARYGYLFEPTSETSGVYVLSLFEDSVIKGPRFLLKGKRNEK